MHIVAPKKLLGPFPKSMIAQTSNIQMALIAIRRVWDQRVAWRQVSVRDNYIGGRIGYLTCVVLLNVPTDGTTCGHRTAFVED